MKKAKISEDPDMPREIDFRGGERGRYAKRFARGTNLVLLEPDVAKAFPDSDSVNTVLRVVMRASAQASRRSRNRRQTGS